MSSALAWTFTSNSEAETNALGESLCAALEAGSVVGLIGNLGAGKTRLVKSIAAAAGIDPREVTSPTFVLVHEYSGRNWPLYHFDTYRLRGSDSFLELGADEYFSSPGVCLVEWADRVEDVFPADGLWITIRITGETTRAFTFAARGTRSAAILERLKKSPPCSAAAASPQCSSP